MKKSLRTISIFTMLCSNIAFAASDQKKSEPNSNCSSRNNNSAECANAKRTSNKKEVISTITRKPPKPPKQISPVVDELPERREDDF